EYNLSRTIASEVSIMGPRYAWQAEDKAVAGYEDDYTAYMHSPVALLLSRSGYPAPTLSQPKMPDMATVQQIEINRQDIMASVGRYEATIGEDGNEKSGTAIKARQQSGDLGSQDFKDHLAASITNLYRVELKAIPRTYDTERMLRIVAKNGSVLSKTVNQKVVGEDGVERIVNNLAIGRYDLKVTIGPGYTAQREEASDKLAQLTDGSDDLKYRTVDLAAKYSDSPMADSLKDRVESLVPDDALSIDELQERMKKNAERDQVMQEMGVQNPQVQEMQQTMQQMEQVIQELQTSDSEGQAKQAKAQSDTQVAQLRVQERQLMVQERELDLQIAQANAEGQGLKAQAENIKMGAEVDKLQRDDEKLIDEAQSSAIKQMVERDAAADMMNNEINNGDNSNE
ncbi:MAG: hypothetical protein KAG66_08530, partial [Methylococcales bacterium]|nr:hypothetical protein [Methylococcales bacterium]